MKVCHVCSGHSADDGRVFHRACVALAAKGYEVHLIASSNQMQDYCERGVMIHPLPKVAHRRDRLARRAHIAQMAAEIKPDLFHVHEPELLGPIINCAGSRPVIWDVHESYLDVLMEREWIPRPMRLLARTAWDKIEQRLVRRCAGVIVVTERIATRYRRMNAQVRVVANFPELREMQNLPAVSRDGKTCVFAGGLSPDRGLFEVIQALGILRKEGLAVPLTLAGPPETETFMHALMDKANQSGVGDLVTYHGILAKSEALRFQHQASIGLVPYLPVANSMASMANKLLECMALGLPLVFSNFPNYQEIAGESGAGIAVDPTQPAQIADAIQRLVRNPELAQQMGEAGKRSVQERFNWNIESAKLFDLYQILLGA